MRTITIEKPTLSSLSGLRFFLALYLIVFHFGAALQERAPQWVGDLIAAGYFSTSTFFLLSGFILSYAYLNSAGDLKVSTRRFLFLRFSKIYPLHLLFFILMLPFFLVGNAVDGEFGVGANTGIKALLITSQLVLLDAWNPYFLSVNSPAWSISALLFFYLLFPFFTSRIRGYSSSKLLKLLVMLWLVYLIYPAVFVLMQWSVESVHGGMLHRNPIIRLPEFLIGVVLSKLFLVHYQAYAQHGKRPFYAACPSWAVLALSLLCLLVLPRVLPYPILHNGAFTPIQALLVLNLAARNGRMCSILSQPIFKRLSEATLVMYLGQWPVYRWYMRAEQLYTVLAKKGWSIVHDFTALKREVSVVIQSQSNLSLSSFLLCTLALILLSLFIQERFVNPVSDYLRHRYEASSRVLKVKRRPAANPPVVHAGV